MFNWSFDSPVPSHGYRWWYLDALSDEGDHGITVIAFIGTVFSPWYAWSRRWGEGNPENYCCLNVALYGQLSRWTMTDRRKTALARTPDYLRIGPSSLSWDGEQLIIDIDETNAPIPQKVRGRVRLIPEALSTRAFRLDTNGRHYWQPIAPRSRVEVTFQQPSLKWSGRAYFDTNAGSAALETDFRDWDWCRATQPDATAILYNAERRNGSKQSLALRVGRDGEVEDMPVPRPARLPRGFWGVPRPTRSEDGQAQLLRPLTDAPFYTRSEIKTTLMGRSVIAMHESLALDRFMALPVQIMLPLKVPRTWR